MSKALIATDSIVLECISTLVASPRHWVTSNDHGVPVIALYEGNNKPQRLTVEFDSSEAIPIPDNAKIRLDGCVLGTVDMLSKGAQDELWRVAKRHVNSLQEARTANQLKSLESIDQNSAEASK